MLRDAIADVGGVVAAASICGVTPRAVYKWLSNGRLPRTEYTGETQYAKALEEHGSGAFTADKLLKHLVDGATSS